MISSLDEMVAPQSINALGRIFPIPPEPFEDESGNSWIQRLCMAHHCTMRAFKRFLNIDPDYAMYDFDTDKYVWPTISQIAGVTRNPCSTGRLKLAHCLQHYCNENFFFSRSITNGPKSRWCQLCWTEDKVPYARWQWRLTKYTRCTKHGIEMSEACPWCQSPFVLRRSLLVNSAPKQGVPNLSYCGHCFMPMIDPSMGLVTPGKITKRDFYWIAWDKFFDQDLKLHLRLKRMEKKFSENPETVTLIQRLEKLKCEQEDKQRKAQHFLQKFMTSEEGSS